MAKTVGDFLFRRLRLWNVKRVFGYPGDGINGIVTGRAAEILVDLDFRHRRLLLLQAKRLTTYRVAG